MASPGFLENPRGSAMGLTASGIDPMVDLISFKRHTRFLCHCWVDHLERRVIRDISVSRPTSLAS